MAKFELHTLEGNRLGLLTWQTGEPVSLDSDKDAPKEKRLDLELALKAINGSSGGQIFYDLHERGFSKVYARSMRVGEPVEPKILARILRKFSGLRLQISQI